MYKSRDKNILITEKKDNTIPQPFEKHLFLEPKLYLYFFKDIKKISRLFQLDFNNFWVTQLHNYLLHFAMR